MKCRLLKCLIDHSMEAGWFWLDVATILPYDRLPALFMGSKSARLVLERRGYDTVGNLHRAQIYRSELFELVLVSKVEKQFPVTRY